MKIVSDGITNEERELLYVKAKEKNNIYNVEKQLKRNITEKMKEIFKNKETVQNFNELNNKENVVFTLVTENDYPKRQITEEEYNAFPDSNKNSKYLLPKAILSSIISVIVFLAFLIFYIYTFNLEKPFYASALLLGALILTFIVMAIFIKKSINEEKTKLINKNSKISIGNVIQFRDVMVDTLGSSGSIYYVDVAFYNEKKYAKRILCSEKVYNMLSLDSEVIIYNSRVYVYDKNNNIIC